MELILLLLVILAVVLAIMVLLGIAARVNLLAIAVLALGIVELIRIL